MFSGVRESGWQGACCIFCRLHDHQTKNDKGLYRLCRTERPLPRRQKKEVTQEMKSAATASVLKYSTEGRMFLHDVWRSVFRHARCIPCSPWVRTIHARRVTGLFLARALLLMHIRVTEHYPGARYASLQWVRLPTVQNHFRRKLTITPWKSHGHIPWQDIIMEIMARYGFDLQHTVLLKSCTLNWASPLHRTLSI